jgi:amino acid transporter
MVTFLPVSSPFIRFAGRFVDDAFGVAAGWNFFIFEAALVPFEIVACNVIIGFWSDVVPTGAIIAIVIVLYAYVISLLHHRVRTSNVACRWICKSHATVPRRGLQQLQSDATPLPRHLTLKKEADMPSVINMMAVKWYGETEFWAAIGKVLLIIGLLIFTFISMLGGNPQKDRYGFRYWKVRVPLSP